MDARRSQVKRQYRADCMQNPPCEPHAHDPTSRSGPAPSQRFTCSRDGNSHCGRSHIGGGGGGSHLRTVPRTGAVRASRSAAPQRRGHPARSAGRVLTAAQTRPMGPPRHWAHPTPRRPQRRPRTHRRGAGQVSRWPSPRITAAVSYNDHSSSQSSIHGSFDVSKEATQKGKGLGSPELLGRTPRVNRNVALLHAAHYRCESLLGTD